LRASSRSGAGHCRRRRWAVGCCAGRSAGVVVVCCRRCRPPAWPRQDRSPSTGSLHRRRCNVVVPQRVGDLSDPALRGSRTNGTKRPLLAGDAVGVTVSVLPCRSLIDCRPPLAAMGVDPAVGVGVRCTRPVGRSPRCHSSSTCWRPSPSNPAHSRSSSRSVPDPPFQTLSVPNIPGSAV